MTAFRSKQSEADDLDTLADNWMQIGDRYAGKADEATAMGDHAAAIFFNKKAQTAYTTSEKYSGFAREAERKNADHIDGYDRDDLGESPDY